MTEREALEPVMIVPELKDKKKRKRRPKHKCDEKKDPKRYGFIREYKEVSMDFS